MKWLGSILVIPLTIGFTLPWIWFLFGALTGQGWLIGIWGIALTWLPFCLINGLKTNTTKATKWAAGRADRPKKRSTYSVAFLFLATFWIVLTLVIAWRTPPRQSTDGAAVSNQYSKLVESSKPFRFSLSNVVPEKEQINLGFRLMPLVDPVLTHKQVDRISDATFELYDELESDSDFRAIGSVLGSGYSELMVRPYDNGHYFLYVPESAAPGKPIPAIIFLHGSGGNFKPYIWLWSRIAEKEGMAIIAPSFGFGNWKNQGGPEAVQAAIDHVKTKLDIDSKQVFLAGLSNGGLGVSNVAALTPQQFRGVIYLSPVFNSEIINGPEYQFGWHKRPHLVVTGKRDKRIPYDYVNSHVDILRQSGVNVAFKSYPKEDHFLFFTQADAVLEDISKWLEVVRRNDEQN